MADEKSVLEIILSAKDQASSVLGGFKGKVDDLSGSLKHQQTIFHSLSSVIVNFKGLVAGTLAALGVGAIVSTVREAVDTTVELSKEVGKLQRMTGMSAEAASELIAVADQVGISFDTLQNAVVAVTRKMGGLKDIQELVTDASGKSVDVFEKFGITIKNTDGTLKPFAQVFEQIRAKIQSTSSETERLAIATQFFRGSAADLMPLLSMTSEQYKEIAEDARKYGLILTQDNISAVKEYVFAQRDLDDAIQGAKLALGKEMIPVLIDVVKWVTENAAEIKKYASFVGTVLVDVIKIASGMFYQLKSAAYAAAAALMEIVAQYHLFIGNIADASKAHEKAKQLFNESIEAANNSVDVFNSVGKAAKKSGEEQKKAAEEIQKTIPTYKEWLKTIQQGTQEYIDLRKKELETLKANVDYEKALLAQQLANKTIPLEQYLEKVKALNKQELDEKVKLLDQEIALYQKAGASKYQKVFELEQEKNKLILQYKTEEVKQEQEAAEKVKKIQEDGYAAWKSTQDLRIQMLKSNMDLQVSMNEEAVRAGAMRESDAMKEKLEMLRVIYREQITLATEAADQIAAKTGPLTEKDRQEYERSVADKKRLQLELEQTIIESEGKISDARIQEEREAAKFIAEITKDQAELQYQQQEENLEKLERYYQQGLISAEQYYDALSELDKTYQTKFQLEVAERSEQLNRAMEIVQERRQRLQESINSMMTESWEDVKKYFGDWKDAVKTTVEDVQYQIDQFMDDTTMKGYETFWNAQLFGRRLIEMTGTTIYEWSQRVTDYINYIKSLVQSLEQYIMSLRLQLAQLRGDRMTELEMWYAQEKKKIEEQYKDLQDTQEYYDALALLLEIYAEKKKKILAEIAADEEEYNEKSESGGDSASTGGGGGGTGGGVPQEIIIPSWLKELPAELASQMQDAASALTASLMSEIGINGPDIPSEISVKKELNSYLKLELPSIDKDNMRRVFEDTIWPLFKEKYRLMGLDNGKL